MAIYKDENELLNTDWQAKINEAVAKGDYAAASQYEQARNDKINSPNYTGTITQTTNNYSQYSDDPWVKYSGTNYHQDAINAAQGGDWTGVMEALGLRQDKIAAQGGDDRGKTNQEIWDELWAEYGGQETFYNPSSSSNSFNYDSSSRPAYSDNGLSARIDEMLNGILNRDAFSYNAETDPLYQQYANMYQREGKRAMNDAMASAAAQAGGMNSYAMTAAQQANNYYNAQLNDKIPELYQLAYEMYLQDIDNKVRDYGLLNDMDDKQYNRYRDTMSDWENDRNFAFDVYKTDVAKDQWQQEFDTSNSQWQQEFDTANNQWQQEFDNSNNKWQQEFDNSNSQWQQEFDTANGQYNSEVAFNKAMEILNSGAMPDAAMLKQAGMTTNQASDILAAVKAEQAAALGEYTGNGYTGSTGNSYTGGNDGGNGDTTKKAGYDNGGMADAQIKAMQKELGVDVDGKWGAQSQAAAKAKGWGTSASEAWNSYSKSINADGEFGYLERGDWKAQEDAANAEVSAAIFDLGIGMVNEDTIWQMMQFGGIVEKDGKFVWANGWNKNNWQEKMASGVKNGGIGLYAGVGIN